MRGDAARRGGGDEGRRGEARPRREATQQPRPRTAAAEADNCRTTSAEAANCANDSVLGSPELATVHLLMAGESTNLQ